MKEISAEISQVLHRKKSVVAFVLSLIAVMFCLVFMAAFSACSVKNVADERVPEYVYDELNCGYVVSGISEGKGDSVEIPSEVNGKRVVGVSCGIFADSSVSEYKLGGDVFFTEANKLANADMSGKKIYAERKSIDNIRARLFECANDETIRDNALSLANSVTLYGLADDEYFIIFNYDWQAYTASGGNVLPVFIGGENRDFDIALYEDYAYVRHREKTAVSDLDWAYSQGNGYILSDITVDGASVFGGYELQKNAVAAVSFERVYRVYFHGGNDEKYDLTIAQPDVCFDQSAGEKLPYRYVAESRADGLLGEVDLRRGFALGWEYSVRSESGEVKTLSSLSSALTAERTDLNVYPVWTVNVPQVTVLSSAENNTITYGEDVTFYADAVCPIDGATMVYEWRHNGEIVGEESSLKLVRPSLNGAYDGTYTLKVTVLGDEITSCGASAEVQTALTIKKKKVGFGWVLPEENERVYDGTAKRAEATFDSSQLVEGDEFSFHVELGSTAFSGTIAEFTNAAEYVLRAVPNGLSAANYEADSSAVVTLEIAKCPVQVRWSEAQLVYNGLPQSPSAEAIGLSGENLIGEVLGSGINAGTHRAQAVTRSCNYTLVNAEKSYTINKAPLTVKPRDCTCVYGFQPTANGVEYSGLVAGDSSADITGSAVYSFTNTSAQVGAYADCVRVSGLHADNYEIAYSNGALEIVPRNVEIGWNGVDGLVYNSLPKNVTAYVSNAVSGDEVCVTVENGNCIQAGEHVATASLLTGADSANYSLARAYTCTYAVSKAKIWVSPTPQTAVYGDAEKPLRAEIDGVIYNGEVAFNLVKAEGEAVGSYDIRVEIADGNSNYEITCGVAQYVITPREAVLGWMGADGLVYNGGVHVVGAVVSNKIAQDDLSVAVNGGSAVNAGDYTATAALQGGDSGNYFLIENTFDFTVEKAEAPVEVFIEDTEYGEAHSPSVTGNLGNGTVSFSYGASKSLGGAFGRFGVGTYFVTANVAETANYKAASAVTEFEIVPREVSLEWKNNGGLVYDSTAKNVSAKIGKVLFGDDVAVEVYGGKEVNAGMHAARAKLVGSDAANYKLPQADTCAYEIEKCKISIVADFKTSAYSEELKALTAVVHGNVYNGEVRYTLRKAEGVNAGIYAIEVVVGEYANYEIRTIGAHYTITKFTPKIEGCTDGKLTLQEVVAYGTTLGELTQRLPSPAVSGNWIWADGSYISVGKVGHNSFAATFKPTDAQNYNEVKLTVVVNVKKANAFTVTMGSPNELSQFENASTPYRLEWDGTVAIIEYILSGSWGDNNQGAYSVSVVRNDGTAANAEVDKDNMTILLTDKGTYLITFTCEGNEEYMSGSLTITVIVE